MTGFDAKVYKFQLLCTKPCADGVVVIAISLFPQVLGSTLRMLQEKVVPMNTLVCSCGSFVLLSFAFISLMRG